MSRLVAYMGSDPERLQAVLLDHRDLMQVALPPAGGDIATSLGIGFYQGGEVLLQRRPRLGGLQVDLCEALKDLRTDVFLAQVQSVAPAKLAKNESTPPFRFRSWIMALRGQLPALEPVREDLLRQIPDFLRRNIRGGSECEHVFHLVLSVLHESGRAHLEDANLPPELSLRALHGGLVRLREILQRGGLASDLGSLQIALTNGRSLAILRSGPEPLWMRRLSTLAGTDQHHEHLRGALLFSGLREGDGQPGHPGLEEVPQGHAVLVGRDLNPRVVAPS